MRLTMCQAERCWRLLSSTYEHNQTDEPCPSRPQVSPSPLPTHPLICPHALRSLRSRPPCRLGPLPLTGPQHGFSHLLRTSSIRGNY